MPLRINGVVVCCSSDERGSRFEQCLAEKVSQTSLAVKLATFLPSCQVWAVPELTGASAASLAHIICSCRPNLDRCLTACRRHLAQPLSISCSCGIAQRLAQHPPSDLCFGAKSQPSHTQLSIGRLAQPYMILSRLPAGGGRGGGGGVTKDPFREVQPHQLHRTG